MIDVIRTSASRPDLLQASLEPFKKFVKYSGRLRVLFHEDVLNKEASKECIRIAKENFDEVFMHNPPINQGPSIDFLLRRTATDYVFNIEDDWEVIKEIDLDLMVKIMEENSDVNQIAFHKREIASERHGWKKKEVEKSGVCLTTNPHWAFTPALWRRNFIMKFWRTPPRNLNPVWFINPLVKRGKKMPSADWMILNVGSYFLGRIGTHAYVKHLGFQNSVREGERKF